MSYVDKDSLHSALYAAQAWVAEVNKIKGWHDTARSFGEDVALLHSEVSEMLEAYRSHGLDDATDPSDLGVPEPEGVGSEAADVLVRLLDICYRYEIDLPWEFNRKVKFNETRPIRHGGKRL